MWEYTNSSSPWRPYLDILPISLSTPLFWNNDDLTWLKGTDVESQIGLDRIEKDYKEKIQPFIESHPDYFIKDVHNFAMYKRFGSIVMAYSFTKPDSEIVMMPMADMLNHKTGFNNARLFIQTDKNHTIYEMKTICNISKGTDVYNTYGDLGNSELLRKYGFVDGLDNPHNIISISLKIVLESIKNTKFSHFKEKISFLKQHRLLSDEESFLLTKKKIQTRTMNMMTVKKIIMLV